jgi:hypothetical protein
MLRSALLDVGLTGISVTTTFIDTLRQAERRAFTGSPTILINGNDPFADPGRSPALACGVYPHPSGPTGLPDLTMLEHTLKRAAEQGQGTTP